MFMISKYNLLNKKKSLTLKVTVSTNMDHMIPLTKSPIQYMKEK